MPDAIAQKVRVFGRVQGVFFRQATVNQARTLGVEGWVHNAGDGSVEAYVKGEREAVEKMVAWMRQGPSQARVDDLIVEDVEPEDVSGFSVRV